MSKKAQKYLGCLFYVDFTEDQIPMSTKPVHYKMTCEECLEAHQNAKARQDSSREKGHKHRNFGVVTENMTEEKAMDNNYVGSAGEIVVREYFHINQELTVDHFGHKADIGNDYQVRSSRTPKDLAIRDDDPPDHYFFKVTGYPPHMDLWGWIIGKDGQQDKYWNAEPWHGGDPYFSIPIADLNPMEGLE